jgi:hypothetical protein
MGIHLPRRFGGSIIRVHSYLTEIVTEARFEEGARGGIERSAWRVEHVVHDRRGLGNPGLSTRRSSLHKWRRGIAKCPAPERVWHSHHLLRNPIRFLFVLITGLADRKFVLKRLAQEFLALARFAYAGQAGRSSAGALALEESTRHRKKTGTGLREACC